MYQGFSLAENRSFPVPSVRLRSKKTNPTADKLQPMPPFEQTP